MNIRVGAGNYRNDAIMLGFSDLTKVKTDRPLILNRGNDIFINDENGKDYIESVSCFYCVSLGKLSELLARPSRGHRQLVALNRASSFSRYSVAGSCGSLGHRADAHVQ